MPQAGQHAWSDPYRAERHTDRACWHCGLVKRTRHDGPGRPWQEFYRNGKLVARAGEGTPRCEGSPDQSQIEFSPRHTITNGDSHEAHHRHPA